MNRPALTKFEEDALAELDRIERLDSALTACSEWGSSVYMHFTSGNGWKFCVFEDAGEWDYLEWITAPDGRHWKFGDGWDRHHLNADKSEVLMDWSPSREEVWTEAPTRGPCEFKGRKE